MVLGEPRGSRFKVWFVQCGVCGTAINAMEYLSIGTILDGIEKKILTLEKHLLSIQQTTEDVEFMIRQIKNKP